MQVTLTSQEGEALIVSKEVACQSKLIAAIITDWEIEQDIPLPNIKLETLKLVIQYCSDPKTAMMMNSAIPINKCGHELLTNDDTIFFDKISIPLLIDLIRASEYLDIERLLNVSCARMAIQIQQMGVNEFRKHIGTLYE